VASTHEKHQPGNLIDKLVKKNELGQPFRLATINGKYYGSPLPSMMTTDFHGTQSSIRASRRATRSSSTALDPGMGIHPAMTPIGGIKSRLVPRRQRVFASRRNDRAHGEQRKN